VKILTYAATQIKWYIPNAYELIIYLIIKVASKIKNDTILDLIVTSKGITSVFYNLYLNDYFEFRYESLFVAKTTACLSFKMRFDMGGQSCYIRRHFNATTFLKLKASGGSIEGRFCVAPSSRITGLMFNAKNIVTART